MEMADLPAPAGVVAAGGIDKQHQGLLTKKKRRAAVSAGEGVGGQQPPADACFDCNICLDFAADPVVTLCGHLYCWPCIYKWLRPDCVEDGESDLDGPSSIPRQQQCPVCKAAVSESALVPLYGRGICDKVEEGSTALAVPRRPLPSPQALREDSGPLQPRVGAHSSARQAGRDYLSGVMSSTVAHPLFHGVAVLPFLLSGSGAGAGSSSRMYYSDMYYGAGRGVAERRQEMQSARSLQRVSVFLFLCIVLCLLLF